MFPCMDRNGMMGALAHCVMDRVNLGIAMGLYKGPKDGKNEKPARMG